jgi:long-chain acyl-CoA synthetase
MKVLHHFLETSSMRFPNKIAVVFNNARVSYSTINAAANRIANSLHTAGVVSGDRVALIIENSVEYIVSYYGILKAGGVAVPLATQIKSEPLNNLLNILGAKAVIAAQKVEETLKMALSGNESVQFTVISKPEIEATAWPCDFYDLHEWTENGAAGNPGYSIDEGDLASIIYTSGSTGTPKGVMLSHKNIVENTLSIIEYLNLTDNDIQMTVLPFFYVMGKSLLNTHIAVGGTVVINNKFAFAAAVLNQIVEEKVTGFSGVPSTYAYLLNRSPLAAYREKLGSLRYCSQAGGHMPLPVKKELRKTLPEHTRIVIMYGATEASARLTYLDPARFEDKMGSIGKAISRVTVRILDETGNEQSPNQVGELVASGPNIMQGYWKDPEATAKVLDKNGYHTGDLGYRDEEGFLFVTGRKDSILKVGGHRINPQEVEDAIIGTGLVVEAVVVGIPDELLGNKLMALSVPKQKETIEMAILGACAAALPRYKLPSEIRIVSSLPKNPNGKVDRSKCFELLTANL